MTPFDLIVVGEGVAGLAAAQHAARAGLRTATFEAQLFGGLVINVNELDPSPGPEPASGADFAATLAEANAGLGVESIPEAVTSIVADASGVGVATAGDTMHRAACVVVASGARWRVLGVPGEAQFEGRGVSHCADCDGPLFQDQEVVVVGGGDSALQEALSLARWCRRVHLVHRRDRFRARAHFVDRVVSESRISAIFDTEVEAIEGDDGVERVRLRDASGNRRSLACKAVFPFVGLVPNSEFLPAEVVRDALGHVRTGAGLETTLPRVFAIGAVREGFGGLLADAIDEASAVAAAVAQRLGRNG